MKKFMVIAAIAAMVIACASKEEKYVDAVVKAYEAKDVDALVKLAQDTAGLKLTAEQEKKIKDAAAEAMKDQEFAKKCLEAAEKAAKAEAEAEK